MLNSTRDIPLVSVIIPAFNSEKYILETVENCLYQSWKNKEIIVVDDGSTDNTLNLLNSYQGIPDIRIFNQENSGAPAARNLGIRNAKGDYIQFVDADDLMSLDKIEIQLANIRYEKDIIASCQWGRFNYEISKTVWENEISVLKDLSPTEWFLKQSMMPIHAWLIPRSLILKAGPWDESLTISQDGEYMYRIISRSQGIKFCKDARVYYRSNIPGSITNRINYKNIDSKYRVCVQYEKQLREIEESVIVNKAIANKYSGFIRRNYPHSKKYISEINLRMEALEIHNFHCLLDSKRGQGIINALGWKMVLFLAYYKRGLNDLKKSIYIKFASMYHLSVKALKAILFKLRHTRMNKEPVIIVGCGRSGTSLLLAILDAHPRIYGYPYESEVFHQKRKFRNSRLNHLHHLINLYSRFFNCKIPGSSKRWCEKTPKNVHYISEIINEFQKKIKIIHIYRDGRDVCTSIHQDHIGYYVSPTRWVNDVKDGLRFSQHPQVLQVQYEDLIYNFEKTIKSVLDFIGEELHPALGEFYKHTGVIEHVAWSRQLQPLYKESVRKWENPIYKERNLHFLLVEGTESLMKELKYI